MGIKSFFSKIFSKGKGSDGASKPQRKGYLRAWLNKKKYQRELYFYEVESKYGDKVREYEKKESTDKKIKQIIDGIEIDDNLKNAIINNYKNNLRNQYTADSDISEDTNSSNNETEYERCEKQREYFSKEARKSKKSYYRIQVIIIIAALLSSIIVLLPLDDVKAHQIPLFGKMFPEKTLNDKDNLINVTNILTGICSAVIVFLTSLDKLKQHVQNWVKYRVTSEALKREMNLYKHGAGEYAKLKPKEQKVRFVENYENIIAKDVGNFEHNRNDNSFSNINNKEQQNDTNSDKII